MAGEAPDVTPQSIYDAFCAACEAVTGWTQIADPVGDGGNAVEMTQGFVVEMDWVTEPGLGSVHGHMSGHYPIKLTLYRRRCINLTEMRATIWSAEDPVQKAIHAAMGPGVIGDCTLLYVKGEMPRTFGEYTRQVLLWDVDATRHTNP